MRKRKYIFPVVEVMVVNTGYMMKQEVGSDGMPPGMGTAPTRRTKPF